MRCGKIPQFRATTNIVFRWYTNAPNATPAWTGVAYTLNGGLINQTNVLDTSDSFPVTVGEMASVGWSNTASGATGTTIFGWGCNLYTQNP